MDKTQRSFLEEMFGPRVNFDERERMLYSHDIAAVPSLVKPLVGDCMPDAVVQPVSTEELSALLSWASKNSIPLTPRAKASSGYGGVLPRHGGVVVDFYRMNKVVSVDDKALTATVQPGIVWEKLDRELARRILTLLTYPSSYPGSTAGGWLAQGGAGFGSYEAGWFKDNVVSATVVFPSGEVKTLTGGDLDLVSDAEGTTGFISELTIRVQPLEAMSNTAVGCPGAGDLQALVQKIIQEDLPLWSILFINPRMAELKSKAPVMEHMGHPVEEHIELPAQYIATLTYRSKDRDRVLAGLDNILKGSPAQILDDHIAKHEWDNRFKLMVVKRLGPSLVPAEVVVPLKSLGKVMTDIEKKIAQPVVKEGVIIRSGRNNEPEVVILGFIPADEREFKYNFVFPLSMSVLRIAEKHGGRAYATGVYFTGKGAQILGKERLARMREFKKANDPAGIMNPGKVFDSGLLGKAITLGSLFEPLIRPFGNSVATKIGERPSKPVRGIPEDVAWYAYSCSQCGYCVEECDQFYGRGWESQSPRGKWYWLRKYMEGKVEMDQDVIDTFLVCTTCELCNLRCSAALPIEPSWMKLRGQWIHEDKKMTFPPFEMMAAALHNEGNIWAGYRKDRFTWFPEDLLKKHGPAKKAKMVYFAGCTASYVEHDIAQASVRLLDEAGVDFTTIGTHESCCGTPMLVAGLWDSFEETLRRNIAAVRHSGADTVISSCPACDMMWRHVYPKWAEKLGIEYNITARHYSEVLADKINSGEFTFPGGSGKETTVTWHDSCHMGRVSGVYDAPRDLIKAVPGTKFVEMSHNRENAHCCGSVLTLIKEPGVAADIGEMRLNEAVEAGAEKVLALCPCCEVQLRISADKKKVPVEVVDLAHYAAAALGYEFPDPNPEVQKQWGVFDRMITLMTPQGFADIMGTMWPELIRAMPLGMGPMMRLMGKIPGALPLMKPLFPILFPRLLPMMMPKVLPVMIERIAAKIPMPDYMLEQMPVLMPKVMDNLMPHMIGDVVPLVTQPMIDFLQGKARS